MGSPRESRSKKFNRPLLMRDYLCNMIPHFFGMEAELIMYALYQNGNKM